MDGVTFDAVSALITNGFFPCVMCLILMWYVKNCVDELRKTVESNTKAIIEMTTITNNWHNERSK